MKYFLKENRKLLLTIFVLLTTASIIWAIGIFSNKPPHDLVQSSKEFINQARKAKAQYYSPDEFGMAEKYWSKAIDEWKIQNAKTMAFRDFTNVNKYSLKAENAAKEALKKAKAVQNKLDKNITSNLHSLKKIADLIDSLSLKLPLNHRIRENLTPAKLKISEAEEAYKRGDILMANNKLESVKPTILKLEKQTQDIVIEYFSNYDNWKNNYDSMVKYSKDTKCITIVIDKYSRKCLTFKNGTLLHSFNIELGSNWIGHKKYKGDMATPEGLYTIVKKKNGNKTKYHKALLINYPNDEDKARFLSAKNKGEIPKDVEIGGLVEIHGHGGKGADWTEGCVALENNDMDKLFNLCSEGTKIAIIGSIKTYKELMNCD